MLVKIKDTKTTVFAMNGNIVKMPVRQDAILLPFNASGWWNGAVDNVLYSSSAGVRTNQPMGQFATGCSSIFHEQLAQQWQARRELSLLVEAKPGEAYFTQGKSDTTDLTFEKVVFLFDPIRYADGQLVPLDGVLARALHAVYENGEVTSLASPLIRGARHEVGSRESLLQAHARAILSAARSYPEHPFIYTVVFYHDPLGPRELLETVESLTR